RAGEHPRSDRAGSSDRALPVEDRGSQTLDHRAPAEAGRRDPGRRECDPDGDGQARHGPPDRERPRAPARRARGTVRRNAAMTLRVGGSQAAARLPDARLAELMGLLKGADTAELKVSIPSDSHIATIRGLPIDPVEAQPRQVFFFDTPDLKLNKAGIVVRA